MGTARDIALIFLSLEALIIALIPLILISALAYGVYRLQGWVKIGLRTALAYARMAHAYVEKASRAVAEPFIRVQATTQMVSTIISNLVSRRSL